MRLARLTYGAVFVVFLPVGLLLWARATSPLVRLPAIHVPEAGAALATLGVLLIAAGIRDVIVLGGGLPMNAFPPPHLVRTRIYIASFSPAPVCRSRPALPPDSGLWRRSRHWPVPPSCMATNGMICDGGSVKMRCSPQCFPFHQMTITRPVHRIAPQSFSGC